MKVVFTKKAYKDYEFFEKTNPKNYDRVNVLIREIIKNPYQGIGKPEALKFNYQGFYSRRIDREHRLVYRINGDVLEVIQCRYHY